MSCESVASIRTVLMFPDYLAAVGFEPLEEEEELAEFCRRIIQRGTALQVPDSELRLVRWSPGDGIHLWMYVNPGNEVESLIPFYYPAERVPVQIERILPPPETNRGQIRLTGSLLHDEPEEDPAQNRTDGPTSRDGLPSPDRTEQKAYEFLFLCMDAPLYREELESVDCHEFQMFASSRRPKLYADRKDFEEQQRDWAGGMNISPRSVIPSGLLDLDTGLRRDDASVEPYAYITGRVESSELKTNPSTTRPFLHLKIDTYGMDLDVLLGKETLPATPEPGNIIEGHFLLLGMMKSRSG